MSFEEFQRQSRLYVIGALDTEELEEFERERQKAGKKADVVVAQCYALHETFALSVRPEKTSDIREQLMSMMRERKQATCA